MGFSTIDYVVLLVYLVGITVFGMRFRQAQRSVKDYFLGARSTSWIVICLSIVATETSTLTLIGVPALAYGTFRAAGAGGNADLPAGADRLHHRPLHHRALFLPSYFRGDLLTAYALLETPVRLGCAPRRGVAVSHHARAGRRRSRLCRLARAVGGPGVELSSASRICGSGRSCSSAMLTLIYTFEGGIAAVIWTDLIQFVIYIGGSLLAAYELRAPDAGRLGRHRATPRRQRGSSRCFRSRGMSPCRSPSGPA